MIYADRVLHDRQVMHRHHVASLCSRATLMRRLREGRWWRPTDWTVAVRTEFPDPDFDLLVASAHVWPDGGIGGTSLPALFGLAPAPQRIEVSAPYPTPVIGAPQLLVRRRQLLELRSWKVGSGRELAIDLGPSSLAAAATSLTLADVAWLLVRAKALEPSGTDPRRFVESFAKYLKRTGNKKLDPWSSLARAVSGGCESAGETFVWYLLESLGVGFRTQHHIAVDHDERVDVGAEYIRTDFLLDGDVILEVDSALHQHIKDVRRDLWNLIEGRRTLRIVGADVIADPVRARDQLAKALRSLGIRVRLTPLPAWLTAP